MNTTSEIQELVRIATNSLARAQQLLDEAIQQPKPASLPEHVRTNKFVRWSTMKQSPKGVFHQGMRGHCIVGDERVAVMLDINLDFQVIEHGHYLFGVVFNNPSHLAAKIAGTVSRNGFDHIVLEGRGLVEWREIWLAA